MYKKPRRYSRRARLRRELQRLTAQDRFQRHCENGAVESGVRMRLQEQQPNATVPEIEAKVEKIMAAGGMKTPSEPRCAVGVPADVQAARRAERKQAVKARRHRRR